MEEMSLPALFEQARKVHVAASDSTVDQVFFSISARINCFAFFLPFANFLISENFQDILKKGCELLRQCEEMINKLGLFSRNETKDDISTTNLKYILVSNYIFANFSC